ncbi:GntR family transcriptional regulator [Mesorhizobium sp. LjNodule214]|uniref:GntR family transcriptional regulator n=1 Tax=Mesorhizobium sp. LjNodule214 TaxID=3342252 RepID=UPI003ED0F0C2
MEQTKQLEQSIDRVSPEPFYAQLSRLIEEAIDRGEYGPGDRIPTESELCRTYNLARSTVRDALRSLEDKNKIRVIPRRGAFVVNSKDKGAGWVLQVADGFFEGEVDHDRRNVETEVLEATTTAFSGAAARALGMQDGEKGFLLRRLRRLDGKVALLSVNYLLPELKDIVLQSDVMQRRGSLNRILKGSGYRIYGARRTVEAVSASEELSVFLDVQPGSPLLLVTSISWGEDMKPFDYYTSWVRTDVVRVTVVASADPTSLQRP